MEIGPLITTMVVFVFLYLLAVIIKELK